jgi:hypothetical protein
MSLPEGEAFASRNCDCVGQDVSGGEAAERRAFGHISASGDFASADQFEYGVFMHFLS